AITRPAPSLGSSDDDVRSGRWWVDDPLPTPAATTDPDGRPPLDDITILEVAYYIAGPMATTLLTELGARVVKVEPLSGDPYRRTGLQSAKFVQGKESLALDLKHPEGRRVIEELIRRSDVIVHSFRQAAANRLGLDAAHVHELNPRIVHLYAASYGSQGPQRDRAAFHSTPNALSGGGIKQAGRGNPPVNDSYADPGSALGAATAILIGLWDREMNGHGQALETTMLTSTGYIHSADAVAIDGSAEHVIADPEQRGLGPNYRLYRCADGWIFVAAVRPAARDALAGLVGAPGAGADEQLGAALEQHFAGHRVDDAVELLEEQGIAMTPVAAVPFDQWLESNGMLLEVTHSLFGDYWRLPPKLTMSASEPVLGPACAPGEHSVAVLEELGLARAAIAALIEADVVGDGRVVVP
ncbi:MAG: CoA transferase, partial [Ilumatobacteraceae bacterium]